MYKSTDTLHSFVKGAIGGHVGNDDAIAVGRSILSEELASSVSLLAIACCANHFVAEREEFVDDVCCKVQSLVAPVTKTEEPSGMARSRY
jgi:hypothetical protein